MSKKRREKKMPLLQKNTLSSEFTRTTRSVTRKTNKMSEMTNEDMQEWNQQSKKGRGLSSISLKDIYEEKK